MAQKGRELLEDEVQRGQAHRIIPTEIIVEVNALVLDNRRITVDEINRLLGISVGTTHAIMHQHLKFKNLCVQWVPHQLTTEQHNTPMSHLQLYPEEEYGFLSQFVTGNKTLCHLFEPESKCQSKQWKHAISPPSKKSKAMYTSCGKVLMSFFHHEGPLLIDFPGTGNHNQYPALSSHSAYP
ncbi:histone-lysine N-methyltransferase SETMAR [Trichonephila clavipes]|nr:histone-lysine N-methyltransferase SETMAR [Trichonephila clavipes]